eukprot:scaffold626_cov409-Prasinococcus_capsulatus_cf.AAC.9
MDNCSDVREASSPLRAIHPASYAVHKGIHGGKAHPSSRLKESAWESPGITVAQREKLPRFVKRVYRPYRLAAWSEKASKTSWARNLRL